MSEVKLYLGDCLEIMPVLNKSDYDAVITDPPYGIGNNNIIPGGPHLAKLRDYKKVDWDTKKPQAIKFTVEIEKPLAIFGANYYADILPISRGWIVWDKNTSFRFADGELIYTNQDRALRIFRYTWNGMIKEKPEERFHPTQKPVEVIKYLVLRITEQGDTILDPFMGSGTTGVACIQTGRNFIGIEIDPTYYEIAEKRIKQAQMQLVMEI